MVRHVARPGHLWRGIGRLTPAIPKPSSNLHGPNLGPAAGATVALVSWPAPAARGSTVAIGLRPAHAAARCMGFSPMPGGDARRTIQIVSRDRIAAPAVHLVAPVTRRFGDAHTEHSTCRGAGRWVRRSGSRLLSAVESG